MEKFKIEDSEAIWSPYEVLARGAEFKFAALVGFKLRVVPTVLPEASAPPLAMRGITVAQLAKFHDDFPGLTSRDKQEQLKEECPINKSFIEWKVSGVQVPQAIISYRYYVTE